MSVTDQLCLSFPPPRTWPVNDLTRPYHWLPDERIKSDVKRVHTVEEGEGHSPPILTALSLSCWKLIYDRRTPNLRYTSIPRIAPRLWSWKLKAAEMSQTTKYKYSSSQIIIQQILISNYNNRWIPWEGVMIYEKFKQTSIYICNWYWHLNCGGTLEEKSWVTPMKIESSSIFSLCIEHEWNHL